LSIGHPTELPRGSHSSAVPRSLDASAWAGAGIPLLVDPRYVVEELHRIHLPQPGATVLGVLTSDARVVAGASFVVPERTNDGWHLRNILLGHMRSTVPHGLRRREPLHSALLLQCRRGPGGWTGEDGAWMWALRDAAALHGLRCGGYITLTDDGWQVIGETRWGRNPNADSRARHAISTVSELPSAEAPRPRPALRPVEPAPRAAAF
jgi:hypothetical protein